MYELIHGFNTPHTRNTYYAREIDAASRKI